MFELKREPLFLKGKPAMFLKAEQTVVIGDVHIGVESKYVEQGIHFPNAAQRVASQINEICRETKAKRVVFLGDIKERIGFMTPEEKMVLYGFFRRIECEEIVVTRGNHDARLGELLEGFEKKVEIVKEFLVGDFALMHGNALPSREAMRKRFIVTGHVHPALRGFEQIEKIWMIADAGKWARIDYPDCNKKIKLVIAPAFSDLVLGSGIDETTKRRMPMLKNDLFEFGSARVYNLDGKLLGRAGKLI
ncbi:MAG: metallophosphoesterase family protein [Candidatus Micrarchaeota archaeon]|nr:metallophosphoesterase family protein [Candidatus Micrarchaeota archaeon]